MRAILNALGLEKHSDYVRDYFDNVNMRKCIYMSTVIIVLELWMIIRLTRKIFKDSRL